MHKVARLRFYPNKSQIKLINETLGCCRYVSNLYIEYEKMIYEKEGRFLSGYEFSRIINRLKKNEPRYEWIQNYSSKAIKDAIMNIEKSFKAFFKRKNGYPKFKSRKRLNKESFYFIKDNIHFITMNIIKIPILGKIRITENKYLPDISKIVSGRVILDHNKYYVCFIYEADVKNLDKNDIGMGIDVGIKNYASISSSTGKTYTIQHFKNDKVYLSLYERIKTLQKIISNKAETNYGKLLNIYLDKHHGEEPSDNDKKFLRKESYCTSGIRRLRRKIVKLYVKARNIRLDFINKLVYKLVVRTKPIFITIEDLSIQNMLSRENDDETSKTLRKYIGESGFYMFRTHLENKCREYATELRIAHKYFASSKICSSCGYKNSHLKLSDRTYICPKCGLNVDRDINASFNLLNTKKYIIY